MKTKKRLLERVHRYKIILEKLKCEKKKQIRERNNTDNKCGSSVQRQWLVSTPPKKDLKNLFIYIYKEKKKNTKTRRQIQ